jgi:hypothetical protein
VNIELQTASDLQVIETDDGPVTQVSLQRLEEMAAQKQHGTQAIADQIVKLQAEIPSLQAQAGAILTAQTGQSMPQGVAANIEAARGLERLITNLVTALEALYRASTIDTKFSRFSHKFSPPMRNFPTDIEPWPMT